LYGGIKTEFIVREKTMYREIRPTCVTVIGWAWIIIGSLMCLSSVLGVFGFVMVSQMAQNHSNAPLFFKIFPLFSIAQFGIAVLAIIAGVSFLKLKTWSRKVLEVLTWLLLLFVLGFMVYWLFGWLSFMPEQSSSGLDVIGAVMGVVITAIYAVPLVIMLRYLRGEKVRNALAGSA
jgi:hypothetical protein